jgi:DMSO/TMAO reductase YedYZ molybdopterin-dependent catalytic subunit
VPAATAPTALAFRPSTRAWVGKHAEYLQAQMLTFRSGERANSDASTYNNFYEFGTDKADPARNAHTLKTRPWTVEVEGEVKQARHLRPGDAAQAGAMEERIYRLRCVEGWSMVIPWVGYSLAELIKRWSPPATRSSSSS